jgi:hypothetical protein
MIAYLDFLLDCLGLGDGGDYLCFNRGGLDLWFLDGNDGCEFGGLGNGQGSRGLGDNGLGGGTG